MSRRRHLVDLTVATHSTALPRSLASEFPDLAAQWHPTRNRPLTPAEVYPKSGRRVTWMCPRDRTHVWEATVASRTSHGSRCPFCSHLRPSRSTSLRARCPPIAVEWRPTKNGSLTPNDVLPGSDRRVWWLCPKDKKHEWSATVGDRVRRGGGCPICSGRRVIRETSLRATHPRVAREWHPTKNGSLVPEGVRAGSNRFAYWRCSRDLRTNGRR
jgi:hypothetical protein